MSQWIYSHGAWRWNDSGIYYRLDFKGSYWQARINRKDCHPYYLGRFDTAQEGKAACLEDFRQRARNPAGTVDRESETNLQISHR